MTSWADIADKYLRELYEAHPEPTKEQIRDAYPFGERRYWPYKAWLRRVGAWRRARALGKPCPTGVVRHVREPVNPSLFGGATEEEHG